MANLYTETEARALCERILSRCTADGAEVRLEGIEAGNARFAINQVTTSADVVDAQATVTARFGQRRASVTFNGLGDEGITAGVARAEQLAKIAPADPELMPLLPAQSYASVSAFFDATAELGATQRIDAVLAVVDGAEQVGVVSSGFFQHRAEAVAVANTAGLFAFHRATDASFTTTTRTRDGTGSGWAGGTHNDWTRVPAPADLASRAIEKARRSIDPRDLAPGAYQVVLEPTAVGNLVRLLGSALDARAADEGRSYFAQRGGGSLIGERVADPRVTLLSDPQAPELLEQPFTDEGLPVSQTVWIENGVLRNLVYSRYWAQKQDKQPTSLAGGLQMSGGTGATEDLVATVERGLLVTRFWYIRAVERRTLLYTGLTRDGTFLIENGRITQAVKNLRFNESPVAILNNVVAMGAPVRVVASESGGLGPAVVVPPLLVRNFRFTSMSDAV